MILYAHNLVTVYNTSLATGGIRVNRLARLGARTRYWKVSAGDWGGKLPSRASLPSYPTRGSVRLGLVGFSEPWGLITSYQGQGSFQIPRFVPYPYQLPPSLSYVT